MAKVERYVKIKLDENRVKELDEAVQHARELLVSLENASVRVKVAMYNLAESLSVTSESSDDSP